MVSDVHHLRVECITKAKDNKKGAIGIKVYFSSIFFCLYFSTTVLLLAYPLFFFLFCLSSPFISSASPHDRTLPFVLLHFNLLRFSLLPISALMPVPANLLLLTELPYRLLLLSAVISRLATFFPPNYTQLLFLLTLLPFPCSYYRTPLPTTIAAPRFSSLRPHIFPGHLIFQLHSAFPPPYSFAFSYFCNLL